VQKSIPNFDDAAYDDVFMFTRDQKKRKSPRKKALIKSPLIEDDEFDFCFDSPAKKKETFDDDAYLFEGLF